MRLCFHRRWGLGQQGSAPSARTVADLFGREASDRMMLSRLTANIGGAAVVR
jgi:hypothetical protein